MAFKVVALMFIIICLLMKNFGFAGSVVEGTLWTKHEWQLIESLWIGNLPPVPPSPGNPVADDPRAQQLGHKIFFDTDFSIDGEVSCATCHKPELNYSDGLRKGIARGVTERRTMSITGAAYSPWLFWDGRSDSLWSQALQPLEDDDEHGGTRMQYIHLIATKDDLRSEFEDLFGPLPALEDKLRFPLQGSPLGNASAQVKWQTMSQQDKRAANRVFANIGRALEAYQRLLVPGPSLFDQYVEALINNSIETKNPLFSENQVQGLQLFIGKAQCVHCHNGPLFTNNEFHNTGLFPPGSLPKDRGRIEGVKLLQHDYFNCLSKIAGVDEHSCDELRFVKSQGVELVAAFRTPSLRNMRNGPYMHTGEFSTVGQVIEHYNEAAPTLISDELEPLGLTLQEIEYLEEFLKSVSSPLVVQPKWLSPPDMGEVQ